MMDCLEAIRAVRMNLFTTAFLTQYGICTSRLGNFQDTHIQKFRLWASFDAAVAAFRH